MKTKKLIEMLQELDPEGEIEVCIGNEDIYFADRMPAYWDGRLQVLIRDEECEYYNIIGAKYTSSGDKIKLYPLSILEALEEDPDLPVEVIDTFINKKMQKTVDRWREEAREYQRKFEEYKKS